MRRTSVSLSLALVVRTLRGALAFPQAAKAGSRRLGLPLTGAGETGGKASGTFAVTEFVATGDPTNPIGAVGTLVLTAANGKQVRATQVTVPVTLASGAAASGIGAQQLACEILELTLGPLDLNLLGLEVHLDQV